MNDNDTTPSEEVHALQCMEIWGGNRSASDAISTPGLDTWVFSEPYEGAERGGDVHYVSACMAGRIARFVVADVAGHGEDVAGFATELRRMMRKNINTPDQSRFTRNLNKAFAELRLDGRFATALLASYITPTKQLVLCNAGHPNPMWYSATSREWRILTPETDAADKAASNLPLGIIEPTEYRQFAVTLGQHDLVLMYTDSLSEARDPEGAMLRESGLLAVLQAIETDEPHHFVRRLVERVRAYCGGGMPDDDMTLLLLHHNGAEPPSMSLGDKMTAVGKLIGLIPV